jgi:hypothetical protein
MDGERHPLTAMERILETARATIAVRRRLHDTGFTPRVIDELLSGGIARCEFCAVLVEGGLCTPSEAARAVLAGR